MLLKSLINKRIAGVRERLPHCGTKTVEHWTSGRIYGLIEALDLIKDATPSAGVKLAKQLCNEVLKYSHGDDLVDLHDTAYYALKFLEKGE